MVPRRLKKGGTGYYWVPPTWAVKDGCYLKSEALGTDYADAKRRCDELLNPQFDAWRLRDAPPSPAERRAVAGTFDWMVGLYKSSPQFKNKETKTQKNYDAALRLVSDYELTDGRNFGSLTLASIMPATADRLFDKLKVRADGSERRRTAILAMTVCRRAWFVARRHNSAVPAQNPFAKMELTHKPKATKPVSYESLMKFITAADEAGEWSIGTAAMIAFFWLQRQTDIISRLTWQHYRPKDAPNVVRVWHHKTGEVIDIPLYDEDGTVLWPELISRLDAAPRRGALIVMRDRPDRRSKVHVPWKEDYFRHRVAATRAAAGLHVDEKFMGLRHGGNTEGADAGLSDAQLRALSGHKTPAMVQVYAKQTMKQRQAGGRMRLDARTKRDGLSK